MMYWSFFSGLKIFVVSLKFVSIFLLPFFLIGYEGHKSSVYCMDVNSSGSLIVTGSEDMTAKVISSVSGKVCVSWGRFVRMLNH